MIAAYVGGDDTAAQACVAAGAQGLVISGYAYNGRPSADQLAGIEKIAASESNTYCPIAAAKDGFL